MKKPVTVPDSAVWNNDKCEWQLGEKNSKNIPVGTWMYWRADGSPCCKAIYDNDGDLISDECLPRSGFASVSWVEGRGDFLGYNFYDQRGKLLRLSPLLKSYEKGKPSETADAAICRYKEVMSVIRDCTYIDHSILEEESFFESHDIYCYKKTDNVEINKIEERLAIKLPPSYKAFILKYGLLIFGRNNNYNGKLFLDSVRMSDALHYEWGIDVEAVFSKEAKQRLDNIITFSYGDEDLQRVWYYCFDFNTLNPGSGEVSVVPFKQGDFYSLANNTEGMCKKNGFDEHMREMVDLQICELVNRLEGEGFK